MLNDIFTRRYLSRNFWDSYGKDEARLLTQSYKIIHEQLIPYWVDGKEDNVAKVKWKSIHDMLCMELGLEELSPRYYSYQTNVMGSMRTNSGFWTYDKVCKDFLLKSYDSSTSPDEFIKNRISFIELAFRLREKEVNITNAELPKRILLAKSSALRFRSSMTVQGDLADGMRKANDIINEKFKSCVDELNVRFSQAGVNLNYHNGFIQISSDELTEMVIEKPFWAMVSDERWKNVDIDIKEAIDRRDSNGRDAAFYAARSLESTIKIISNENGWTHGNEKGAQNYIDNLVSKKNGQFISSWEADFLRAFFSKIRNPLGHGPGIEEMIILTEEQTDWAIETCMSWIKSLIKRTERNISK
ncbi:AbiJ-NTD4 domain-containing protein [Serratia sp. BW106]|uniref:AbiJ-NTD4 domain-containing protein n=1 Tax=Serratia sp. BW106 TaxID=1884636 RepID=UPI0018E08BEC|nr:hypothetical protein [Serratia sp. BW106]